MNKQINNIWNHDMNTSSGNLNIHEDVDMIKLDNMKIIETIKLLTYRKKIFRMALLVILFLWLFMLTNEFKIQAQSNPKDINNLIFFFVWGRPISYGDFWIEFKLIIWSGNNANIIIFRKTVNDF